MSIAVNILVSEVARICHEANKVYCESLGDSSQVSWEQAPENIKRSAVDGVIYKLSNPGVTPEDSHNNWSRFKEADGWVYGEVKDVEAKTHPCLVPYNDLPEEQRVKDHLFTNICSAFVRQFQELSKYEN